MKKVLPMLLVMALMRLLFIQPLRAQTTASDYSPQVFRDSPNSEAFTRYDNYQVNLNSGVPNISIPIYVIESGSLKIPINLSYHASGNKVTDVSSSIGLGWVLDAGGQINRRVMGIPDDGPDGYLTGHLRQTANIDVTSHDDLLYLRYIRKGTYDTQPDIFSYSYPGGSGKFFFDGTNHFKPTFVPYSPDVVTRTLVGGDTTTIGSFRIVDPHGDAFFFGTTAVENTTSTNGGLSTYQKSAWMLERVISQDQKDTISLNYNSTLITTPEDELQSLFVDDLIDNYKPATIIYTENNGNNLSSSSTFSSTTQKDLQSIIFKNGRVDFVQSTAPRADVSSSDNSAKRLIAINISRYNTITNQYTLSKSVKLFQSYFVCTADTTVKRLRLDSVELCDAYGRVIQSYKFSYNTTSLPRYNTNGRDYWGYYNGKDAQRSMIPQTVIPYQSSSSSIMSNVTVGSDVANGREPDSVYMQANVLNKIIYPTGGWTMFSYQTNRYVDSTLKLAGGLRIYQINNYDQAGTLASTKTYQYYNPSPHFNLNNYYFTTTLNYNHFGVDTAFAVNLLATKRHRIFYCNPTFEIAPWDGTPVNYKTVVEYNGDGINNIGKTVYTFRDATDATGDVAATGVNIVNSMFFARGQLASKSEYIKNTSGGFQIVRRERNNYTAFPPINLHYGVGLAVGKRTINEFPTGDVDFDYGYYVYPTDYSNYRFVNYGINADDNYLISKTITTYDAADSTQFVTDSISSKYDNIVHQQVTRTYKADSKGNITVQTNKYAPDYILPGATSTGNSILDSMINRNMIAMPIETWDSLKNVSTSVNEVVSGQLSKYRAGSLNAIVLSSKSELNTIAPLTTFVRSSVVSGALSADSHYSQTVSFDEYDSSNNLAQYTPRNGPTESVLWDYQESLPIAGVKNGIADHCAYTSFEGDGKGNWSFSGTPISNPQSPTGHKCYNLSYGAISSSVMLTTKKYIVSYWSKGGSANVAGSGSISGAAKATLNGWTLYEHLVPLGTSSVSISGSVLIDELRLFPTDAQMTTYTYDPLTGMTSVNDPKNASIYYDYDGFSRLMNVKDKYKNVTKSYCYNYAGQQNGCVISGATYSNTLRDSTFSKGCASGSTGTSVTYTVPAGTYTSNVSHQDADNQAKDEITANGQSYANANGICTVNTNFLFTNSTGVSYQVNLTSSNYNIYSLPLSSGSETIPVPIGTYSISVYPASGNVPQNIALTGQSAIPPAPRATFSGVVLSTGTELTLSVY